MQFPVLKLTFVAITVTAFQLTLPRYHSFDNFALVDISRSKLDFCLTSWPIGLKVPCNYISIFLRQDSLTLPCVKMKLSFIYAISFLLYLRVVPQDTLSMHLSLQKLTFVYSTIAALLYPIPCHFSASKVTCVCGPIS